MARWALTGGMATGKSTVAALFAAAGVPVVDADLIYHELIAPTANGPSPLALQVAQAFGGVLRPDHTLDRRALGAQVFNDAAARSRLNAITHPVVHAHAEDRCAALEALGHRVVLYDIPLLIELSLQGHYAGVVLVYAPYEVQLERVMRRDKLSNEAAVARLASQLAIDEKIKWATHVIDNSRAQIATKKAVLRVANLLLGGAETTKPHD